MTIFLKILQFSHFIRSFRHQLYAFPGGYKVLKIEEKKSPKSNGILIWKCMNRDKACQCLVCPRVSLLKRFERVSPPDCAHEYDHVAC